MNQNIAIFFNRFEGLLIIKSLINLQEKSLDIAFYSKHWTNYFVSLHDVFSFNSKKEILVLEARSISMRPSEWEREFQFSSENRQNSLGWWLVLWIVAETLPRILCCARIKRVWTPSEIAVFPGEATLEFIKFTPFHQIDVTLLR